MALRGGVNDVVGCDFTVVPRHDYLLIIGFCVLYGSSVLSFIYADLRELDHFIWSLLLPYRPTQPAILSVGNALLDVGWPLSGNYS